MLPKELKNGVTLRLLLILCVCSAFAQVEYKCLYCSGDSCEDPVVKSCKSDNGEKICYTQLDSELTDVIAMGCKSDFKTEEELVALIKHKSVFVCNGDNCNDLQNLPSPNKCVKCNSNNLISCAINPISVTAESRCNHILYTQCYERINSTKSGITERGCLTELNDDDFYNCLTNKDPNCFICKNNHCNQAIIPSDRRQCHRCKSTTNPNCHETPAAKSYCPLYSNNDNCFVTYNSDGVTIRGCTSDIDNIDCHSNDKFCDICSKDNCNTLNLRKRAYESYGIFQDLPLNCYTCVDAECQSEKLNPHMCEGDKNQDCITVFNKTGQVVARGCEEKVMAKHQSHCKTNPELCFNCKSNGCNSINNAKNYQECLYCDTTLNPDCVLDPTKINSKRKCTEGCVATLYKSKTNPNVYELVRTCVDDIEMDDRETCTAEKECIKCGNSNNCNVQTIPEDGKRLSCYHCNGNNCDHPVLQQCLQYSEDDQCFMYFDNVTYSAIRMGCKSEFTEVQILNEIKQFFFCDGNQCNSFSNLTEAKFCYVCDSVNDENCATQPTKIKTLARCQIYPNTECYTRVREDGHTERGCIQSLATNDFISCQNDSKNKNCHICADDNCNNALFPNNRQQCQRCDSSTDKNCESATNTKQACPLYKEIDSCITKYTNGITQRGCASELSCENLGYRNCHNCVDHNCNTIDLAAYDVGKLGLFQSLPLNCYHCNSSETCGATSLGNVKMCENNKQQYCTTAFDDNGKVIARGCSDALEEICLLNTNNCYDCKSNGCNLVPSESDYMDCLFCDAQKNSDCVFKIDKVQRSRKCYKGCMTALYPRTSDEDAAYELIRSCLDDLDLDDRVICENGTNVNCNACQTANCNTKELGKRKSCYHCVGNNCAKTKKESCRATMESEQCFIEFDESNSIVKMGCKSIYDSPEIKLLQTSKRLWLCDEDDCNTIDNLPEIQSCTICNSRTDPNCATKPINVTSQTTCEKIPNTQCYTRVLQDGHTERGCLSDLNGDIFYNCFKGYSNTTCISCTGETCNKAIFPENRKQCHVCDSTTTKDCASVPQREEVCLNYSSDEICVAALDRNGVTTRGCSSQVTCDSSNSVLCQICGDNNCNKENLKRKVGAEPGVWQSLPLNCHTCKNESTCSVSTTLETCAPHEHCMTIFGESQNVVKRGCSDSVENESKEYCDYNGENCPICNSNSCNSASGLHNYIECIYCDSKTDKNCVSNPTAVGIKRLCNKNCMTALRQRNNSTTYDLIRSCLDDKDLIDQQKCIENDENCISCETGNCNVQLLPKARQSCYICEGDECQIPVASACHTYKKEDQCFVLFDAVGSVKQMGCTSDLDDDYIQNNIHLLYLCKDEDNCNSYDKLPKDNKCAFCNSKDNTECAINPNDISQFKHCGIKPNTQCTTLIDTDGSTVRSCLSDLNGVQIQNCINSNSTNCKVCNEQNCNIEIYPANRRRCNRCNSIEDVNCAEKPNDYSTICPIYKPEDQCVSRLVGNRLLHGCLSEFSCDVSNRESCRICNTDNCNTINLLASNIGEPGKWQELPLNCLHCNDTTSCTTGSKTQKCENNNLQTCMSVFDENGEVVKRGCSDSIRETHEEYCDEHSNNCVACKSNNCNNATSLNAFVDCYFCDSTDEGDCAVDIPQTIRKRKCQTSCMVALYPRSSSNNSAYETSRSCLDDLEESDRAACAIGDKALCKTCDDALCNKMNVPADRLECFHCSGDDGCEEDIISKPCHAYHPHDQCYILFDNQSSLVGAGCRSEFEDNVVTLLMKQKRMKLCDGKECNSFGILPQPKVCTVCNSATNPNCATNPNLVPNSITCNALPYTECYIRVNKFGHTERGCMASLESETFYNCLMTTDGLCKICEGNNCNENEVYPVDRLKCHQCTSKDEPNCEASPNSNAVCLLYQKDDKCLSNLNNGITTRGCSSSIKCETENNGKSCRTCSISGCNTINLKKIGEEGVPGRWQDIPISCFNCKGESECQVLTNSANCSGDPYQNCITVFNENNKVEQRGCSLALETDKSTYCDENEGKCIRCNSNNCNVATEMEDYVECLACDTDIDNNCVNGQSISKTRLCNKSCMTVLYPLFEEENPSYGLSRTCLDDMELDQQHSCNAEDNDNCKVCTSADCNKDSIPEKRLSCYTCKNENCTSKEKTLCATYRDKDKCYIRFNENNEIDEVGCLSKYRNAEADSMFKQKRLFLCENDNCNTEEILPQPNTCALCNSRTNVNCSVNPEEVLSKTECKTRPFTDCYARILPDGTTERGCISSLYDNEFLNCFNNVSDTCTICNGEECNNEIYPNNRLECHICDSVTDPQCEEKPDNLSICPVYDSNDVCVTSYLNDITYRSCSSSFDCGSTNSRTCVKCKGSGCNIVNLAKRQDDNFGKWQDLPLTCQTCEGEECDNDEKITNTTCQNNNEQDCITVFDTNGKVISRGCRDAIEEIHGIYCDENPDNCLNCKSNYCNTAKLKTDFVDCIYCNTFKDPNCLWYAQSSTHKTRKCQGGCMTALYQSDFSDNDHHYDLIRTCLNDKETDNQKNCTSGDDAQCKSCTDAKCNVDDVVKERLKCYICNGGDECADAISKSCPIYKANDLCYISFDESNEIAKMGCIGEYRANDLVSIIKTKSVQICEGNECNSFNIINTPTKCAQCNSTNDVNCAINPLNVGNVKMCNRRPYTSCHSWINSMGITIRGCVMDLPDTQYADCVLGTDKECELCTEDSCNREIFPADRLQCNVCTSENDETCEKYPELTTPCAVYTPEVTCKTALDGNTTIRDCSTNLMCDTNEYSSCRSCSKTGCNAIDLHNKVDDDYHGYWQDLPLRCHTCVGEDCQNSLGPAITCKRNIYQDCMTVFNETNDVIERGCKDDVDDYRDLYCRNNPHLCFVCKSNECNDVWNITDYISCVFCDSEKDSQCVTNLASKNITTRMCKKDCLAAIKGQQLIRSCLDDKEIFAQSNCPDDETGKECAKCNSTNCNTFVYPSDRLQCHVCSNSDCNVTHVEICNSYVEDDFCFAKYEVGKVHLMGCASSQNKSDIDDWIIEKVLYQCNYTECNNITNLPTNNDCISCNSSKTHACVQNPSEIGTKLCYAPFSECIIKLDSEGHTTRDCANTVDDNEQNSCEQSGTCKKCSGNKCNIDIFPTNRRKCHICNSVADNSCTKEPNSSNFCLIYTETDNCVTKNTDNFIERGCETQLKCNATDTKNCQICDTDNCNTADLFNAAGSLYANVLLITVLVLTLITGSYFN